VYQHSLEEATRQLQMIKQSGEPEEAELGIRKLEMEEADPVQEQ
jgi:hypothetical protein